MNDVAGKHVVVVGLGKSGIAAAHYVCGQGARVTVMDQREVEALAQARLALSDCDLRWVCGEHDAEILASADLIVVSPGVDTKQHCFDGAREHRVPIVSEIELALPYIAAPLVAVTGTNGKSTVTTLLGDVFTRAGKQAVIGGNLGTPVLDMLDDLRSADLVVLEVSSYQIEITPSLQPHTTVMLNVTPDHLDRYEDFSAYIAAKQLLTDRLSAGQRVVCNADDIVVQRMMRSCDAQRLAFHARDAADIDVAQSSLIGTHNAENVAAVCAVAECFGVGRDVVQAAVQAFVGLPHRCQLVHQKSGVRYFDDSKGTNVAAAAKSLGSFQEPVVWIAGGVDKGTGYQMLAPIVRDHVKAMVLLGEAAPIIERELSDYTQHVSCVASMAEAVAQATQYAESGDVVLLSPACASQDMYRDYAERGEDFTRHAQREVQD